VANAEGQFNFVAPSGNAPSSSEILKSKSNAVGGGRKRCSIGKSCSATCIEGVKTCLVELPGVVVGSLIKVRDRIFGVTKPVAFTPVQNPSIKNPPTGKNSPPVNKQTQDKEHNLGLFFWSSYSKVSHPYRQNKCCQETKEATSS